MAINFPSSPSNNQLFVAEGKAMRYVASKGKWKQVSTLTSSQITDLEARTVGVSSMSISGNTLVIQKDDSSYANVSLASFAGNKLTTYANASILPLSDLVSGTQVYVEDTDSLYITDGSGWYKIATVNLSPSLTLGVESISLTSGGSVDVNYTVNEPEDTPYTVTASSTSNATITVYQANNTITFDTPVAATTETITITATDGVNSVGDTLTMTITLGPDWSSPSLDQTLTHPNSTASLGFGSSVDTDGTILVVGTGAETVGGQSYRGVVRTYTDSSGSWTLQQTINSPSSENDAFGGQVSISGNTLAAGVEGWDNGAIGLNGSGAVAVYTYNGSTWSHQATIRANDDEAYDSFSNQGVKLIGDELLVACPFKGTSTRGAAYFFKRSGSTWTQSQKIVSRNPINNERFGGVVDFKGELLIVSGAQNDTSSTYPGGYIDIYTRSGTGNWTYANTIQAAETGAGDQFGVSAAVGENEDYIIVGAQNYDAGVANGAVYVFTGSGNTWTEQAKLSASDSSANFRFGNKVKFGSNAEVAVVGSFHANASSNTLNDAGAAYVFTRSGNTWTQETRLQSPNPQTSGQFGRGFAIANNILMIGSQDDVGANTSAGKLYIYSA
jgi:hypothetical protein